MNVGYHLLDAFERTVALHRDRPAVRCGDSQMTFGALHERVSRAAASLGRLGLRPGDRVAVLSANCHRMLELYWACAAAGAPVVPLEARLSEAEMGAVLSEAAPALLIADTPERVDLLRSLPGAPSGAVCLRGGHPDAADYEGLATTPGEMAWPDIGADAAVAIFYTAAVEGKPRGAVVTHRNLLAQVAQTGAALGLDERDAHGLFLPLSHTFGAYLMFVAACHGAATTILATFDPVAAARRISAGEVTFFAEFAPMAQRIADAAAEADLPMPGKLRAVLGLDVPATIGRYLRSGVRWFNFYGQTETSGLVTAGEVVADDVSATCVGRPLSLSRLSLRDQDGAPAPEGEAGEAWVRSDAVVERYWPDEPTRLTADGWLRTGDVLRADSGGRLWFIGRTSDKDLIKPGGLNVYPAEVERVLGDHPAVARAFVFGVPDSQWRERVCAVVVPAAGASVDVAELAGFCQSRIARFKCPQSVLVAPELAASGEPVTRQDVKDRFGARLEASDAASAPG